MPYLYQGDEIAFGGGSDPDMLRNMLFGETLGSLAMFRAGTQPISLTPAQIGLRDWLRNLGATRSASRALRRGDRKTLVSEADLWVYAPVGTERGRRRRRQSRRRGRWANGRRKPASARLRDELDEPARRRTGHQSGQRSLSISIGAGEAAIFVAQ